MPNELTSIVKTKSAAQIVQDLREMLGENWLAAIYQSKVRSQRTRAMQLNVAAKENQTEIFYTLLGVELKVGKQRVSCPDLATARFLQVFARIGCASAAIPYDITKISVLADELEQSWQHSLLLIEQKSDENPNRLRAALIKELRREIEEIGAGANLPQFDRQTKQRSNK